MKTSHKLFFAIPFDSATRQLYGRVCNTIRNEYRTVTTVIGAKELGPSPKYSGFASFKAQNRELTEQFVAQITQADIIIADLTHNNPNVHVELGIALLQNKNILRVTGRSLSELGFDIRNLKVHRYEDELQLVDIIMAYLKTFFEIKQLPISTEFPQLYYEVPVVPIHLQAFEHPNSLALSASYPPNLRMRDGALQAEFEITRAQTAEDWFGIFFRAGTYPTTGSHLVYVRKNGQVEVAVYPGPRVIEKRTLSDPCEGRQVLRVEFENNELHVQIKDLDFRIDGLSYQTPGRVRPGAWCADANVHSLRMICRDTIEWDQTL